MATTCTRESVLLRTQLRKDCLEIFVIVSNQTSLWYKYTTFYFPLHCHNQSANDGCYLDGVRSSLPSL